MKVIVTSTGKNLDAKVDYRFGRSPYFILVDTENFSFESIPNEASSEFGGAGVKAAQKIIETGAEALITGDIGPNAYQVLSSAGIKMYQANDLTIKEAIEKLKNNELKEIGSPTSASHMGRRWIR